MNMTINDVLKMFCFPEDVLFNVYDLNAEDVIFAGDYYACEKEILNLNVVSIDNIYKADFDGYITFNVKNL